MEEWIRVKFADNSIPTSNRNIEVINKSPEDEIYTSKDDTSALNIEKSPNWGLRGIIVAVIIGVVTIGFMIFLDYN